MSKATSAHFERELAWLRVIQAHVTQLGLFGTADHCVAMRKAIHERWAGAVFRFAG